MKSGILKDPIDIYKSKITTTEYGDSSVIYELYYSTRARVQYNSGSRVNENSEIFYPNVKTFIVRHYVPVEEPMRIKYDGKYYQIESINKDEDYHNIVITATLVNE